MSGPYSHEVACASMHSISHFTRAPGPQPFQAHGHLHIVRTQCGVALLSVQVLMPVAISAAPGPAASGPAKHSVQAMRTILAKEVSSLRWPLSGAWHSMHRCMASHTHLKVLAAHPPFV
jgi:hypothetical protein